MSKKINNFPHCVPVLCQSQSGLNFEIQKHKGNQSRKFSTLDLIPFGTLFWKGLITYERQDNSHRQQGNGFKRHFSVYTDVFVLFYMGHTWKSPWVTSQQAEDSP